jgi:acyl-CoA synthetase (AMP-forming)/AMP-acid ligase II
MLYRTCGATPPSSTGWWVGGGAGQNERVTVTAAVPTVWLGLLQYLEENNLQLHYLKAVVIGGSACPRAVLEKFENVYKVEVQKDTNTL